MRAGARPGRHRDLGRRDGGAAAAPEQALWIARRITRAYVVVAGDLPAAALPGVPEVAVGGLAPEHGKRLFRSPYGDETPPEPPRRRLWWLGPRRGGRRTPGSIERRMDADPGAADELARNYLLRPRIVKEAGRLFDAHPNITVPELLELLRRSGPARPAGPPDPGDRFRAVFQSLLVGVPKDGRRMLALMAPLPYAAYEPSALTALARWPRERTDACLSDLAARTLVRKSPGGVVIATRESAIGPDAAEPDAPGAPDGPEARRAAAEAHRAAGLERAYHHFSVALDLAEDIGEISGQAHAREMIGGVLARQQKTQAALREWEAAGELWAQVGDEAGRRRCDAQRALGAEGTSA